MELPLNPPPGCLGHEPPETALPHTTEVPPRVASELAGRSNVDGMRKLARDVRAMQRVTTTLLMHWQPTGWLGEGFAHVETILGHRYRGVVQAVSLHSDLAKPVVPLDRQGPFLVPYLCRSGVPKVQMWARAPFRQNPADSSDHVSHVLGAVIVGYVAECVARPFAAVLDSAMVDIHRYLGVPEAWVLATVNGLGDEPGTRPQNGKAGHTIIPGDLRFVSIMPLLAPMSTIEQTVLAGLDPAARAECTDRLLFTLLQAAVFLVHSCKLISRSFTMASIMVKGSTPSTCRMVICGHSTTAPIGTVSSPYHHQALNYMAPEELRAAAAYSGDDDCDPSSYSLLTHWSSMAYAVGRTWEEFINKKTRMPQRVLSAEEATDFLAAHYSKPVPANESLARRVCRMLSVEDPRERLPLRQGMFMLKPETGIPEMVDGKQMYVVSVVSEDHTNPTWKRLADDPREESWYTFVMTSRACREVPGFLIFWHYHSTISPPSCVPAQPPTPKLWDDVQEQLANVRVDYIAQNMATGELVSDGNNQPALMRIMEEWDPTDQHDRRRVGSRGLDDTLSNGRAAKKRRAVDI
jgi:hypothetical protein